MYFPYIYFWHNVNIKRLMRIQICRLRIHHTHALTNSHTDVIRHSYLTILLYPSAFTFNWQTHFSFLVSWPPASAPAHPCMHCIIIIISGLTRLGHRHLVGLMYHLCHAINELRSSDYTYSQKDQVKQSNSERWKRAKD